jgi:RNA polymerase sigma factor (sigma-70 family)
MSHSITTMPGPVAPSSAFLGLDELLAEFGVDTSPGPGETARSHSDRVDTQLMALFRDTGRRDVFDLLYRHARGRLIQWIRWLVQQRRSRLDPGDLLQDTFVNVYRYAKSFREEHRGSFRSWVRTIAANAMRRAMTVAPRYSMQALPDGLQEPLDPARGPELRLVDREESSQLSEAYVIFLNHYTAAFEKLSPRDRRALHHVEIEGLSYAETGAELRVGPSNMKMIMLRSRRRLLAHMRTAMLGSSALPAARTA